MGTVLAAHHELLDLTVAVKLMSPDFVKNRPMVERFLREARAAARLKSEHVARVTDVGTLETGQPFIVMELLQGEDLEQRGDRLGPFPVQDAVDAVLQALEGMAQAHATGIVHRDLKPGNLFLARLPDGREVVKVLDFGIAKLIDTGASGAGAGSLTGEHVLGSPSYMAPEQIRNSSQIDHRADIWAIGVILYEVLTGKLPFQGETVEEIFGNVLVGSTPRLRTLRQDVPADLEAAVERCLQREPAQRFADVHELACALAPHGSGVWAEYVPRIAQTLARGGAPQKQEVTAVRRSPYVNPGGDGQGKAGGVTGDADKGSLQETLVAKTIESVRVPAPPSRTKTALIVLAVVLIAGFAALAVLRPRAPAKGGVASSPASGAAPMREQPASSADPPPAPAVGSSGKPARTPPK